MRIGDLAINIMDAIKNMREDDVEFRAAAMAELAGTADGCKRYTELGRMMRIRRVATKGSED